MNQYLTPELLAWIREARAAGQTEVQLTEALLAQGWPASMAAQVLSESGAAKPARRRSLVPLIASISVLLVAGAGTAAASYQGYLPAVSRLAEPAVVNEEQATRLTEALIALAESGAKLPNRAFSLKVSYTPSSTLTEGGVVGTVSQAYAAVDGEEELFTEEPFTAEAPELPQIQLFADLTAIEEQLTEVAIETLPLEIELTGSVYETLAAKADLSINLESLAAQVPAWPATFPKKPVLSLAIPEGGTSAFISSNLPLYVVGETPPPITWYELNIPADEFVSGDALNLMPALGEADKAQMADAARKLVPYVSYSGIVRYNDQPAHKLQISLNRAAIEALNAEGSGLFPAANDALSAQIDLILHRDSKALLDAALQATYTSDAVGKIEVRVAQKETLLAPVPTPSPVAPIEDLIGSIGF